MICMVLTLALCLTIFSGLGISASAANNTSPWAYSPTPTRAIYYKSPVMTGNDVRWVQQALNLTINAGLAIDGSFGPASKAAAIKFQKQYGLTQDGSVGPATRAKTVSVLNSMGYFENSSASITTADIQNALNRYNYTTGMYWTYPTGGSATSGFMASTRPGRSYSYRYNGVECYGFANFVMHIVTGTTVNPNNGNANGWRYIKASDVTELKVGDIVRIGKNNSNGHSGIVLTVNNGKCTFAQVFGGVNNKISIGTSLASSSFGTHNTLASMKANNVLLYVYRYVGN